MTVVRFPKQPVPAHLRHLQGYDLKAARRGVKTMRIIVLEAEQVVKDRLLAIIHMPEFAAFGAGKNELALLFCFETSMSPEDVRAEVLAIRKALAAIGVQGMAIDPEKEPSND